MTEGFFAYDVLKYRMAISAAPPDTFLKLGDLEVEMVECTTCHSRMEARAAEFHTHPVKCLTCGATYDANLERHDVNHTSRQVGAATIGHADGCEVVKL